MTGESLQFWLGFVGGILCSVCLLSFILLVREFLGLPRAERRQLIRTTIWDEEDRRRP